MSSGYPYQQSPSAMPVSTFYPQSMAVLTPSQANLQSIPRDSPSGDYRTTYIKSSVADVLGTSMDRSSTALQDVSGTSPYRQPVLSSRDNISTSPYTHSSVQPAVTSAAAYSSSIDGVALPAVATTTNTSRNVVYSSSEPFPQTFNGMTMAADGNYYASGSNQFGANQQYSNQFGSSQQSPFIPNQFVSNQFGGQFGNQFGSSQFGGQFGNQFAYNQFGGGLTPRGGQQQSFQGTITTTQNGVTTTVPLTSATQMALNGMYQDSNVSQFGPPSQFGGGFGFAPVNILPTDPSMMMFADSFRNDCMMLSQYYQEHPDERPVSPKNDIYIDDSPAWSRPAARNARMDVKADGQENECTANATPVNEKPSGAINTLLDQLACEDDESEDDDSEMSSPSPHRQPMSPPLQRPVPKQSWLSRFACGRALSAQFGH